METPAEQTETSSSTCVDQNIAARGTTCCISVRPSVHLPVHPSTYPSIRLPIRLSVHLPVHPSTYPSIRPPTHPSVIYPSTYPSIYPSTYPSIGLSALTPDAGTSDHLVISIDKHIKIPFVVYIYTSIRDHLSRKHFSWRQPACHFPPRGYPSPTRTAFR